MAALHSIRLDLEAAPDRSIQFKSPDYQRTMVDFRQSLGTASDYEKFRLFLEFEQASRDEIADLTGVPRSKPAPVERSKKNFIPYLKEKLIWN